MPMSPCQAAGCHKHPTLQSGLLAAGSGLGALPSPDRTGHPHDVGCSSPRCTVSASRHPDTERVVPAGQQEQASPGTSSLQSAPTFSPPPRPLPSRLFTLHPPTLTKTFPRSPPQTLPKMPSSPTSHGARLRSGLLWTKIKPSFQMEARLLIANIMIYTVPSLPLSLLLLAAIPVVFLRLEHHDLPRLTPNHNSPPVSSSRSYQA